MNNISKKDMSLRELILNHAPQKYYLINCTLRWAKEVAKRKDAPKTAHSLLEVALRDILTEKVTIKEIEKLDAVREEGKAKAHPDKDGKKETQGKNKK